MANDYMAYSFEVPVDHPEAVVNAISAEIHRISSLEDEDFDALTWPHPVFGDCTDDMVYGCYPNLEAVAGAVWVSSESCDPYSAGMIAKWILNQNGAPDHCMFTWASWCDKLRTDSFSGGVVVVTKDGLLGGSAEDHGRDILSTLT